MIWYRRIAGIIGGPILIAIVILAWKMIVSGISPDKRIEVKDNLMRLIFGAASIGLAPIFVKFMLFLNNTLVSAIVFNVEGGLDAKLGNSLLTSINTGNAIATAIVIAMFAYLFVKINIKFIIRQFTLIVFTIFTPIVAIFWILNKRTIASSIWFGQIIINAFMQFIYAFLFLIYLTFLPATAGWAVSLLWAMMILPLADALQNTMQNLVSKMAGVNNEEIATRGIGMGAAMGYTIKSIAYQFKGDNNTNQTNGNSIINKVVNHRTTKDNAGQSINGVSYESHSHNIMENQKPINQPNIINETKSNEQSKQLEQINKNKTNGIKKAFNVGKEFMNLGMYMAEGKNYRSNDNTKNIQRNYNNQNTKDAKNEQNEENIGKIVTLEEDINDE